MRKKQFRDDLLRGLGSCQLALEQSADLEEYREDVLWGVNNAFADDAQRERTQALYLFEMIKRFGNWSEFHNAAASGAKRNLKDPGWRFLHFAEIIALMGGAGYVPAQETAMKLYELLLYVIRTGRPSKNDIWSALDNFSRLCVSIMTNVMRTQADRETFYLRVLSDYGKILYRKPMLNSRCADERFEAVAKEYIGEVRIHELLTLKKDDPDITRYLENHDQLKAEREAKTRK